MMTRAIAASEQSRLQISGEALAIKMGNVLDGSMPSEFSGPKVPFLA